MKKLFLALATILLAGISYQPSNAHISMDSKTASDLDLFGGAYLTFAGKHGGDLTKQEVAKTKALEVEGCAKGSVVFQFSLEITKNGKTTTFAGKSNDLTTEMHNLLKQLSAGDEFTFKNTKARLPKEEIVEVWAKKFTIV